MRCNSHFGSTTKESHLKISVLLVYKMFSKQITGFPIVDDL